MSEPTADVEVARGEFGENPTALINLRDGKNSPPGEWAHLHVAWYTSHPECYRDEAIVKRMQNDFDPQFRPVVVKHVWRRPDGGLDPRFYHVMARLISGADARTNLGEPLTFTDAVPENYRGDIYEWLTLCRKPVIDDGRPDEFVPFDERTYALLRDTVKDYQVMTARQVFIKQREQEDAAKAAVVNRLIKEGEYRMNHDGRYAKRALQNALVGFEDMRVWHQPSKVMPGTELHPSGLIVVKS